MSYSDPKIPLNLARAGFKPSLSKGLMPIIKSGIFKAKAPFYGGLVPILCTGLEMLSVQALISLV